MYDRRTISGHGRRRSQAGLTLIEVLVAFTILAGVMASVLTLLSQNTQFMVIAEDRLMANILADNLMVEELLDDRRLDIGSKAEQRRFAGREFFYSRTALEVNAGVYQVRYEIRRGEEGQTLARVVALREQGP